jgi:copper chaperone CopZ
MHPSNDSSPAAATTELTVTGMTCGHCVASVTEEVQEIPGVHDVVVDLATGRLTFSSDQPVPRDTVQAAVREAGYDLT